jgi:hypothetical protein
VVIVSAIPYQIGLGFYLDDWQYQETLARFSGDGLRSLITEMIKTDPHFMLRPIQLAWLVLEFKVFGRYAVPYHIVISAVLGVVTVLLYLALRELGVLRWLAVVIAIVFGISPHYSTDRFWIASQQSTVCMAFAFLGIYALSKSVRPKERYPMKWGALAVSALVFSILSYEVALGLIIASLCMIGWRGYIDNRGLTQRGLAHLSGVAGAAAALLLILMLKTRAQKMIVYHHHFLTRLGVLIWQAIKQAILFNFWTYGLHLPSILIKLYRDSALSLAAVGTAAIIAIVVTAYLWRYLEPSEILGRSTLLWLIVVGFVIFGLGFAIFFPDPATDFSNPGIGNRVAIASAPGEACVLVAIVGLACSFLNNGAIRTRIFSIVIGVICAANSLVVSGIANYWDNAATQQTEILKAVRANVHSLPHGSVLLLDGFCKNSGPGFVFLSDYDTTSALHLALNDDSLAGDVISRDVKFGPSTVDTSIFGNLEGSYPYGDDLFVYNVRRNSLDSLPSREAAQNYLNALKTAGESECPSTQEWNRTWAF